MDLDFELYKGKTFSALCKDIVKNSEKKRVKIDVQFEDLRGLIKTINDALLIVPLMKDYLDVGVKNDDQLIKLAAVVQRLVAKSESSGDGNSSLLSEEEREQLLNEVVAITDNGPKSTSPSLKAND
jgi:hypothetical protein